MAAACALLALALFGRSLFGQWCRRHAARDLDVWALGDAQKWLARSDRFSPRNPETELMRARCFRQLLDMPRRDAALELARQYGASPQAVQREITLGRIQTGELGEEASSEFDLLLAAGASPDDVSGAYVSSAIARKRPQLAAVLVDAWQHGSPNHPHVLFLRGVLRTLVNDSDGARALFEQALKIEPRHEMARLALAQMDDAQRRIDAAIDRYRPLAAAHPENALIASGYARVLRKAGRLEQAKSVLEPLAAEPDVLSMVAYEMISIELELGDYRAAKDWFDQAAPTSLTEEDALTIAAITLSMLGEVVASDVLVTAMFDKKATRSLVDDLRAHLAANPQDVASAARLQNAMRQMAVASPEEGPYVAAIVKAAAQLQRESPGQRLYLRHCSACHGPRGDAAGHAARLVFPQPRNLRTEPMRLVSTLNAVPTRADIRTVIRHGVPGTSMVPLETLSDQELDLLVEIVLQMRREGVRETYLARLPADEEPVEADVQDVVQLYTTPGEVVEVPELGSADSASLALGKQLYVLQACESCHGETGTGDRTMPLFDTVGRPCFPRDLVHDVFKGGNDPASIYRRILLGMPGTPHPASVNMTTEELIALTHYCYSLGREPKHTLTNHERFIQASRRPAVQWNGPAEMTDDK